MYGLIVASSQAIAGSRSDRFLKSSPAQAAAPSWLALGRVRRPRQSGAARGGPSSCTAGCRLRTRTRSVGHRRIDLPLPRMGADPLPHSCPGAQCWSGRSERTLRRQADESNVAVRNVDRPGGRARNGRGGWRLGGVGIATLRPAHARPAEHLEPDQGRHQHGTRREPHGDEAVHVHRPRSKPRTALLSRRFEFADHSVEDASRSSSAGAISSHASMTSVSASWSRVTRRPFLRPGGHRPRPPRAARAWRSAGGRRPFQPRCPGPPRSRRSSGVDSGAER